MGGMMTLPTLFGQPAPWDLLPVFAFVAAVTAYWAAMGRMLGFMLFPREGAAGGAWSFLLSPVSAAGADLPLALFVFRSPLAPASLLLPITACFALTVLCGTTFDRERLMETGLGRTRKRRVWLGGARGRRHPAPGAGRRVGSLAAAGGDRCARLIDCPLALVVGRAIDGRGCVGEPDDIRPHAGVQQRSCFKRRDGRGGGARWDRVDARFDARAGVSQLRRILPARRAGTDRTD